MYTDFDEMDIEPKAELALAPQLQRDKSPPRNKSPPPEEESPAEIDKEKEEELQNQLLLRTVPLEDGSIGYVFTCKKNGPLATWRCHVCNFVDSWNNLVKHLETVWHNESMSKFQHPRANFSKFENAIPDISKGQPLPPGMEDVITGPCQLWKTLETYDHPLIGLEFLLELNMMEMKEPRYLCLLCNKRGDPRSILVHLTSQSHYVIYLRKYFKSLYALVDKLPKSNECRGNVNTITAHLIAKLEEKYGRLQPTGTRDDVINIPEQRTIMLQKIDSGIHFVESPEDKYLEDMLTVEYVQNPSLLHKNFPLKPKSIDKSKTEENSKSMFHKTRGGLARKQIRPRNAHESEQEEPDVVFVSARKPPPPRYDHRMRELSPRSRSRSYRSSRSPPDFRRRHMSPSYYYRSRHRSRSPRRRYSRSPHDRRRSRSPYRSSHHPSSRHGHYGYTPDKYHRRTPSPDIRGIYGPSHRGHSRSRSRSPPPHHHHHRPRERSPHHHKPPHKSRSPKPGAHKPKPETTVKISKPPVDKVPAVTNNVKERPAENNTFGFQKELKEIQEKLDKEMELYTETPENHPAYQDEWKKFWCNRFKELQAEGKIDPHTHDYKPEWITFWNIRVKELHTEELERRRNELKTKYGLTEEQIIEGALKNNENPAEMDEVKKPVIDIKTMWKELTGFEIKETPTKQKIISPWEDNDDDDANANDKVTSTSKNDDKLIDTDVQPISPEPLSSISDSESRSRSRDRSYSRSRSNSRSRSRSRSRKRSYSRDRELQLLLKEEYPRKSSKKIHFENPLNIITVLRQLSVLEFQLGSYASHIITLLSSGLAMERVKSQSSVELLTKENVIFLELVKEKLKGQLLAGVVPKSMVKATLFCIKNIEELLLLVPKVKNVPPPPVPAPPPGLLYGAGVEGMPPAAPTIGYGHPPHPGPPPHPHMYHPYGMPPYGKPPPHGPRIYDPRFRPERYPFRPPKKPDGGPSRVPYSSGKEEFPFAESAKDKKPEAPPVADEIPIDKILIAKQIAEVLTAQGRTDVSESELQSLINTVVETLKRNNGARDPQAVARTLESLFPKQPAIQNVPPPVAAEPFQPPDDLVTIPDGFDLNDVPSSTLAILKDAYANVSTNAQTFSIEQLPESEVIQLLRNFKSIPRFKQEKLIEYLRKLEDSNPERVEELKKYVNVL